MIDTNYRSAKGRRLDGRVLATRIAQIVNGMTLAQAFVMIKSAGFRLRINKLDGVPRSPAIGVDESVNVDVVDGIVKKSWAA